MHKTSDKNRVHLDSKSLLQKPAKNGTGPNQTPDYTAIANTTKTQRQATLAPLLMRATTSAFHITCMFVALHLTT